ncbi:hypothetical protein [Romboutsia hominis]|nr:hypothetical protein [Romboutsia hominis]
MKGKEFKKLKEEIIKSIEEINDNKNLEYIYFTIKGIKKSSC